jgi:hypothetical protein
MAVTVYNRGKWHLLKVGVDNVVLRALLERSTSAYAPDPDHDFLTDFTGGGGVEITTTNYARLTLAGVQLVEDDTNDRVRLDATDPTWSTVGDSSQTEKGVLVYARVGADDSTPADDVLVYHDDLSPVALNGGDFGVTFDPLGLVTWTNV